MRVSPIHESALVDELAERIVAGWPARARVLLDGPPPAEPERIAERLAQRLRVFGRPTLHVLAGDFLRPASLRLERGRTNPDEFLEGWLDVGALRREVLEPAGPDGSGEPLPRLWNPLTDRAYRDQRAELPPGGVLLLSGGLLLGRGLPAELSVHLSVSDAALTRRLAPELQWTLPAYTRYAREHHPRGADVVVLADDPRHPARLLAD